MSLGNEYRIILVAWPPPHAYGLVISIETESELIVEYHTSPFGHTPALDDSFRNPLLPTSSSYHIAPTEMMVNTIRLLDQPASLKPIISLLKAGKLESRESAEDGECSGRLQSTSTAENIDKVSVKVRMNRLQTMEQIAETVVTSKATCQRILTKDPRLHRACQHIIPLMLNTNQ
ncbi:hypothetical protein TNCV_4223081 [Trichonephila clavipes]|nr:hypothetical protein TNCV_4223081 [Trichonephila clavipes]